MYGYEWTDEYGIFRLTVDAKLQKEIRPVFKEELDFFNMRKYWDYPDTDEPLLWVEGVRRYVLNGECVAEAKGGGFYSCPEVIPNTKERLQLKPIDVNRLYEVNKNLMRSLEQRAIAKIRKQHDIYKPQGFAFVCAFSGGKDSIVLLDLCAKTLAPSEFFVIFSDTGMELSDTYKAVEKAKERWDELRFYEAKCHMAATESWDEFGPPGRRMRWCCTVHKSVPTMLKLRELTNNFNVKAVVYDGVRAEESAKRAKYEEVSEGAKNICQNNVHPILKWNMAELYCYILKNSLMLNKAYRYGLYRVGCMVCPLSSEWWEGIANRIYANEMQPLISRVEEYAKNAKSEKEAKSYVENGGWRARVGGKGLKNGGNRVKEQIKNNWIIFSIENYHQKWEDVSKLLGAVVEETGGKKLQKISGRYYEYKVKYTEKILTVEYHPFYEMDRFVISHLRGVAHKVGYCIGCKACTVQCPTGAFTIQDGSRIAIRENMCVHCYNCLEFNERACLVSENMRVPEGGFMNMKGLDPYHHFGLKQEWLAHFIDNGLDCFSQGVLGSVQYSALRTWLKEAGLIDSVTSGKTKTIIITDLGKKLIEVGAYNPLTWAVVWANLAYNSTICHWFALSISAGSNMEKSELVEMLGDDFSKVTRENAITALTDTFRYSPIGSALMQGMPIEVKKGTYTYLRDGWSMPDSVALLYSLYLYAEHTGRHSFTLTELIKVHETPDAPGVSPADIYGLDNKKLRDCIQGLALTFPEHIRVSFINDLDNIILDSKYSSVNILDLAEE